MTMRSHSEYDLNLKKWISTPQIMWRIESLHIYSLYHMLKNHEALVVISTERDADASGRVFPKISKLCIP